MSIQTVLNTLSAIRTLIPLVVQLVDTLEAAMPQGGQGAKKLEAARAILQTAVADMDGIGATFDAIWPALSAIISARVAIAKATSTAAPAVSVAGA
jgi:hypothetical protein